MPTTFRAYHPDQILLLAPDLREWVPEGHLSHQVSDLVDSLDLVSFYAPYEGDGRRNAPYEPSMMLKVLIYGYATGVHSSRAIASEAGGGRGVSYVGGRQFSTTPDDLRVSPSSPKRFRAFVRGGGWRSAGDGSGTFRGRSL